MHTLLVAPAAPAALVAQQTTTPKEQPAPQPNTPAVQNPRQPQSIPALKLTNADLTSETSQRYFTAQQFATLEALGRTLVPSVNGNPGAIEAHAPEFLDFLLSVSPAERQTLYKHGLDALDAKSGEKHHKPFSQLDGAEAGSILKPLFVVRPWPEDFPTDPLQKFVAQVHDDLRTATRNSREWAEVAAKSGHRFTRGRRGSGLYWAPIDPITES